jgi:hypothetical protein
MNPIRMATALGATLVCIAATAAPAAAVVMKATWTGTVANTLYNNGGYFFGGGDLEGQSATLVFEFDTTVGLVDTGYGQYVKGGANDTPPSPSPGLRASVTIGGETHSITPETRGVFQTSNNGYSSSVNHSAYSYSVGIPGEETLWGSIAAHAIAGLSFSSLLDQPVGPIALAPRVVPTGNVGLSWCSGGGAGCADAAGVGLSLDMESVEIARVAPVPLPAPLVLLLSGLFGIGLLARRRRDDATA